MTEKRSSGILLHPTSLPGRFGIGDLGPSAYRFADWLSSANQKWWQMLPLCPTDDQNSPYQSQSCFAGNPMLISPEMLAEDDLLTKDEVDQCQADQDESPDRVDFGKATQRKIQALEKAAARFLDGGEQHPLRPRYRHFCETNGDWLDAHGIFLALWEANNGKPWRDWSNYVDAEKNPTENAWQQLNRRIEYHKFLQWTFYRQWNRLRKYCSEKGVRLIGDLPIYVSYESVDLWANRGLFQLDSNDRPELIAGVPPDYFSSTGQLWGNPLYDWKAMKKEGYKWWIRRIEAALMLVDTLRLDHFRGFEAYWAVPAGHKTAQKGDWVKGPGADLFEAIRDALKDKWTETPTTSAQLPFIAEDLGLITPPVTALRKQFGLPGMLVIHFLLNDRIEDPEFLANMDADTLLCTATHDNDTTIGWFKSDVAKEAWRLEQLNTLVDVDPERISWQMMQLVWSSSADIAVAPLQDVLSLDSWARMNLPGASAEKYPNWSWRFREEALTEDLARELASLTKINSRAG